MVPYFLHFVFAPYSVFQGGSEVTVSSESLDPQWASQVVLNLCCTRNFSESHGPYKGESLFSFPTNFFIFPSHILHNSFTFSSYFFILFPSYFFLFLELRKIPSFLLGSGTWKNSKLPPRPWDLKELFHISSFSFIFLYIFSYFLRISFIFLHNS